MTHVTLIPGDGTGPELCDVVRACVEAAGAAVAWDVCAGGAAGMDRTAGPFPEDTLASFRRNKVALKGPFAAPPQGSRNPNVFLRQMFDLYACVRPCKRLPGVKTLWTGPGPDLVVIRENTEDLYCGLEFDVDRPETAQLTEWLAQRSQRRLTPGSALSVKPISRFGSRRIVQYAFNYARRAGRRRVTAVHKANIMRATDGLFLAVAREVARDYPDIEFHDMVVDNLCMQMAQRPEQFDVLVLPNLYGDIVSDLAAGMAGGLAVAHGANVGEQGAVFEASHGSSPKHRGQDRMNPTAMLLAAVLMLRHLNETSAADRLEAALVSVLRAGKDVTYDLKPQRDDPTAVGTKRMGEAIVEAMARG